ncbi:MAG TPA: wax ester/triacylglycerol synthase family O-acyltransferase [Rhodocyclaceae bacterium]|nr:wax ester/triacylglycerol synthase family O-acyltransferase [Rhodocyclaceae bacterium]
MSEREKMSAVDTAWLRMDRPSNLMMIVGILALSSQVDFKRLKRTVEFRLAMRFRRFRQRVQQDALGAWWEDDPEFDIDNHVIRRALPAPGSKMELQRLASELAAEPLNPSQPLWRFDFIENYEGGAALVVRIHHCIADGIALVGVMLSMTDLAADAAPPEPPPQNARHAHSKDPWLALLDPMTRASSALLGMTARFWTGYLNLLARPDEIMRLGKDGVGFVEELVKLLAMPADSPTRFKGRTGARKQVAWCEPIPLEDVKALGKALGCSVNDVMLTAVAGALRSYLIGRGDDVSDVQIRALVPVNLRSDEDNGTLGNRFGMVTLLLPVYEGNPFARLFKLRERMLEMKDSYQPPLTLALLAVSGIAPKLVQEKFLDMLANKASAVMTNVPGPRQPLYLAGSQITQIMFWVPQSGNIGMGVSILSYNNTVQFGLITDRHFVPDPDALTPLFLSEFDRMLTALMLHDWNQPLDPVALEQTIEAEMSLLPGRLRPVARRTRSVSAKQRMPKRFREL